MADRLEHYKKYGWKTSETNLATLPDSAPQAAKDLTKWLTLNGRKKSLTEWLGCVRDDERIHGKFWHIGAWTHRGSHSSPNLTTVYSPFQGEPKTPIEEIKSRYDLKLRSLFKSDGWLIGTDAEGIQLRILTHYMKSEVWREAICTGDKTLGTDIHSMNMKALGRVCRDRDSAKTFIYAWLLGASIPKVAEILKTSIREASTANTSFLDAFPELKRLKNTKIPFDANRGYFEGLDGRLVQCNSQHHMLAGYLQNGEAVIMKMANVLWRKRLKELGIRFRQVNFVHDEWQTESFGSMEDAEKIAFVQRASIERVGKDLGLFCPLSGSSKVGKNWGETH